MSKWVLRETLASKSMKRPIYFKQITAIGPMSTDKADEAARFSSEREAKMSPAYVHPLSFYEPEQEPVTSENIGAGPKR